MKLLQGVRSAGLVERGTGLDQAALVSVYLRDMAYFGAMNEAYKLLFPSVEPAARVCVQLDLPDDCAYLVEIIVPVSGKRSIVLQPSHGLPLI